MIRTRRRAKKPRNFIQWATGPDFLRSRHWLELRYRVLKRWGGRCMLCGRTAADGAIIQVDHIKPRSKFPRLALEERNLQVLCLECNGGKSNKDATDWRPTIGQLFRRAVSPVTSQLANRNRVA